MTKLYHGADGTWQVPGQQDKKAARVDVPNPPAELAAWLNERRVSLTGLAGEPMATPFDDMSEEEIAGLCVEFIEAGPTDADRRNRCPECKALLIATPEGADKAAIGRTIDRITDWMQAAPDWALDRITENLTEIAAELRNRGRAH